MRNKVYIKVNSKKEIIAINSDEFITDLTDWILIDEGEGYQYRLAQNNYVPKPIINFMGDYVYKYIDGEIVEIDQTANLLRHEKEQRIYALKKLLADTFYQFMDYSEGLVSEEEYAPIKAQRQAWRDEINELESTL